MVRNQMKWWDLMEYSEECEYMNLYRKGRQRYVYSN